MYTGFASFCGMPPRIRTEVCHCCGWTYVYILLSRLSHYYLLLFVIFQSLDLYLLILFLCLLSCFLHLFSIFCILRFCIFLYIVSPFANSCLFLTFVQVYRPLPPNSSKLISYLIKIRLGFSPESKYHNKSSPFLCQRIVYFTTLYRSRNDRLLIISCHCFLVNDQLDAQILFNLFTYL